MLVNGIPDDSGVPFLFVPFFTYGKRDIPDWRECPVKII